MKKTIICIISIILICGFCLAISGCESGEEDSGKVQISDLKQFSAFTLDNELFTQDNFTDHDLTIIVFWAPWSEVSVYEIGQLGIFMESIPDRIQWVTICFDGTEKTAKEALNTAGIKNVCTLMSGNGDFKIVSDEIRNIPTIVFVNSKGKIIGDPIVGAKENIEEFYTKEINKRLKKMHKQVIESDGKGASQIKDKESEETSTNQKDRIKKDSSQNGSSKEETSAGKNQKNKETSNWDEEEYYEENED